MDRHQRHRRQQKRSLIIIGSTCLQIFGAIVNLLLQIATILLTEDEEMLACLGHSIHQASIASILQLLQLRNVSATLLLFIDKELRLKDLVGIQTGPYYIKPRSLHWWNMFGHEIMNNDPMRWKEYFRLSAPTFKYVCSLVEEDLQRNPPPGLNTIMGRYITVEKQVALCLRRLASGDSWLGISETFGVAKPTCINIFDQFIVTLILKAHNVISWPEGAALEEVKAGFRKCHGFPNCVGALDCTHIPCELPSNDNPADYYDWKGAYSMTMQAIVDIKTKFLDIFVGFPGCVSDRRVWSNSGFRRLVESGSRLNGPLFSTPYGDIPEYLIADGGYDCVPGLLVPFPKKFAGKRFEDYNFMHSSTRIVVERSFGILKRQWRLLTRRIYRGSPQKLSNTIVACCILHNIIVDRGDRFFEDFDATKYSHDPGYSRQRSRTYSKDGHAFRNTVMDYVLNSQQ